MLLNKWWTSFKGHQVIRECPFSVLASYPWWHITFSCSFFLIIFGLWQFLKSLFVLHDIDTFEKTSQLFCRIFLNLGLSDVTILGKNTTPNLLYPFQYNRCKDAWCQNTLLLMVLINLDYLVLVVSVGFPYCKVTVFLPGRYFQTMPKFCYLSKFHPLILLSISSVDLVCKNYDLP